jgi:hypothetical protein
MADVQIAPTSYLGYAFKDQHNLVVLFGAVCFSAAFASPVPLLVGAVSELLWLSIGPNLPVFRGWIDRRLNAQYLARAEVAIEGALGELSDRDANRYRVLAGNAAQIIASAEGRLPADQVRLALHRLLELRRTFLDYLFLGQRVEALRDATNVGHEDELAELRQSYSSERELGARMTIRKQIASLQRQMSQHVALGDVQRNLALRLEMLEQALPDLKGRLAQPACDLALEINGALAKIGPAEALELTVDEILEPPPVSAGL